MRKNEQQIITTDLVKSARAEICRRSLFCFVQEFWEVIIQEAPVWNWHIPFLCEELQKLAINLKERKPKPYDIIINIPPGTTKSTIVSVMFPAWLWTIDPTLRVISNSYSGDLSIELATKSKDIIDSDKYKSYFPNVVMRRDKNGKQHYENDRGGFRYATSTGATITGYHAHIIINDDPVNPKQANSESMRATANAHTQTLSSRKVNKENTPVVTIMQRLHEDDVTGYLLKKKGENIRHICLPAELCENVSPQEVKEKYIDGLLDPIRLSRSVLEEAKIDLGSVQYAGQYEQRPTAEGGNIVKAEWFKRISLQEFNALRFNEPIHFYLDTAYKERNLSADNDPSGILAACKIGNNIYIVKAQRVWKSMPDLLRFIPDFMSSCGADGSSVLHVEPKANGESVVQMLEEYSNINVKRTPTPTDSKMVRFVAVTPRIECGRTFIVEGDWNETYLDEVCAFPNASHDEFVDITGYAINDLLNEDTFDYSSLDKSMFGL